MLEDEGAGVEECFIMAVEPNLEIQLQALNFQQYAQGGYYSDLPASLPPGVVPDLSTMAY